MPVNVALGHVSNAFLIAALVIYSLSVVAFAGDFAFGRPRRAAEAARGQQAQDRAAALAPVGAASAASAAGGPAPAGPGGPATPIPATTGGEPADGAGSMPELEVPALRAIREAGRWVVAAVALAAVGAAAASGRGGPRTAGAGPCHRPSRGRSGRRSGSSRSS